MTFDFAYFLIAMMFLATHIFTVHFFLKKINKIQSKLSSLNNDVSLLRLTSPTSTSSKKFDPKMMEGDLDLVFNGKSASVRAIFYPRRIS